MVAEELVVGGTGYFRSVRKLKVKHGFFLIFFERLAS
jgi:hypothetical protein